MAVKAESDFIVLLTDNKGLNVAFTEFDGGDQTRSTEKYPDPLKDKSGYVLGTAEYGQITLRVPYDPKVHDNVIITLKKYCIDKNNSLQVTVQPMAICPEQTPDGNARIYLDCLPATV